MTSKNSLPKGIFDLHLIKDTIRKNAWLITLAFVISFFAMPVATALQLQNLSPLDQNSTWFISRVSEILIFSFSIKNPLLIAMFSGAALISACVVFKFLHSKKQIDFFHSLPIRRERLFMTNYLAGLGLIILPYLANAILTLLVITAFGKLGYFPVTAALWGMAQHLLFFIAIYSVVVLAAVLTGNGVINVLFSPVLLGIGPALVGIYMLIMTTFYQSFYAALFPAEKWVAFTSPFARYVLAASNMPLTWKGGLTLIVFIIAIFFISLNLYLRRPSEAAGNALAFKASRPIIKYPLVFIATSMMGLAFYSASNMQGEHFWLLFGFICGAFISNGIIEIIYHFDFKALKRNYKGPITFFILFLLFFSVPVFDLTSYNEYIPGQEDIASVSLYMDNVDSYGLSQKHFSYRMYVSSRERNLALLERGLLSQPENIQAALGIITSSINHTDDPFEYSSPARKDYSVNTGVNVLYTLKNGKQIARSYNVPIKIITQDLSTILDSPEYKLVHFDLFTMSDLELNELTIREITGLGDVFSFNGENLSDTVKSALFEAYKKDFMSLDSETLKSSPAIAAIMMEQSVPNEGSGINYFTMQYPIFPSFSNTLAELENLGISIDDLQPNLENISHIEIYLDYYQYEDTPAFEEVYPEYATKDISSPYTKGRPTIKITDKSEIAQVIRESWPADAFGYSPFYSSDYSREINVYYVTETESYNQSRFYAIKNF